MNLSKNDLECLSRRDLQQHAKSLGIPANKKSSWIIDEILSLKQSNSATSLSNRKKRKTWEKTPIKVVSEKGDSILTSPFDKIKSVCDYSPIQEMELSEHTKSIINNENMEPKENISFDTNDCVENAKKYMIQSPTTNYTASFKKKVKKSMKIPFLTNFDELNKDHKKSTTTLTKIFSPSKKLLSGKKAQRLKSPIMKTKISSMAALNLPR